LYFLRVYTYTYIYIYIYDGPAQLFSTEKGGGDPGIYKNQILENCEIGIGKICTVYMVYCMYTHIYLPIIIAASIREKRVVKTFCIRHAGLKKKDRNCPI